MKMKWVFFSLWIFCIFAFVIGQFLAPPEYSNLPGNLWGELFGISVILGIISFILMLVFMAFGKKNDVVKESTPIHKKYNLSFQRILSRILLTGFFGIVFGLAMLPFLTIVDGLLYEHRASIGGQNLYKMVALWGIFTIIVSLFTFWKKRFRMVSVLLAVCWLLSLGVVAVQGMYSNNNYRCTRSTPYPLPNEFNRSLDLISQRMGVDKEANGTVWQSAFNYRNCLDIQYLESDNNQTEAYFEYPDSPSLKNLQDLKIFVNPSYKNFDDLTLATLLAHEVVHAGQYINEVTIKTKLTCLEKEANAFTSQLIFASSLNEEERRSIFTRIKDNVDKNPTFKVLLLAFQRQDEAYQACLKLQDENSLNTEQFNSCVWTGVENKILKDVKESPFYQEQCKGS